MGLPLFFKILYANILFQRKLPSSKGASVLDTDKLPSKKGAGTRE